MRGGLPKDQIDRAIHDQDTFEQMLERSSNQQSKHTLVRAHVQAIEPQTVEFQWGSELGGGGGI
jgi:hypothetical protein